MRLNIFSFIWFSYLSWWHDCLKLLPLFKKLGNLFSYYCIFEKFYIFCIWGSYICDLQIFSLICNLYFFIPFNKVLNKQKFLMLMVWFIKFFSCDFFQNHNAFLLFSRSFPDSDFTLRSMISFEFILHMVWIWIQILFACLPLYMYSGSNTIYWKDFFPLHIALVHFSKINWPWICKNLFLNLLFYLCICPF